ncbi:MAG TPA: SUMF1/EgtB/PvdO family nonheme iron enzyme [Anaerolineales bacterium]|nr:SUMF1/EgtB/PvdO family nonheme iron enzyme [Anaerolineales bacterium]
MSQVFISYSRRDLSFVEGLAGDLKRAGLEVWFDLTGLEGGERWGERLQDAIRNSQYVIVVLSPDSVESQWVEREFLYASNQGKKIIPLLYRRCELPLSYLNLNYIDVQGENYRQNYSRIVRSLNLNAPTFVSHSPTPSQAQRPSSLEARPRGAGNTFLILLGALMVVGMVVCVAAVFLFTPVSSTLRGILPPVGPAASALTLTPAIAPAGPTIAAVPPSQTPVSGNLLGATPPSPTAGQPVINIPPSATAVAAGDIVEPGGVLMRLVAAGSFIMGSDSNTFPDQRPMHRVDLDVYYIDKYEVTNAQYKACVNAGACQPPTQLDSNTHSSYFGNPQFNDYPVIYVDWNMSKAYCEWRGARLPTEAEWEKAARGTDGRTAPWGEGGDCQKANYMGCVGDTTKVGSYDSGKSPYGVYDMVGNVWEWVADFYDANYYASLPPNVLNPLGPPSGTTHPLHGSSWHPYDHDTNVAFRGNRFPTESSSIFGFRCVRSAP